jgi:hypothetical protein
MFKKSNRKFNAKKNENTSTSEDDEVQNDTPLTKQNIQTIESNKKSKNSLGENKLSTFDFTDDDNLAEFKIKRSKDNRKIVKELKKPNLLLKDSSKTRILEKNDDNTDIAEQMSIKGGDSSIENIKKTNTKPSEFDELKQNELKQDELEVDPYTQISLIL